MTVANTKAKSVYNANGVTREWQIGFDFDANVSKLNIILEDIEGNQSVIEDNYIIEDGAVIYPTVESELDPVAEGNKIIIFRTTPLTQEKDLADNIVESGLDKLTLQVQEISEQVGRAIKVPISEDGLSQYKNPITEIREETKKSLEEIQSTTDVVSSYTAESATNAATSKEEADRAVEASNVSVMASSDAEAAAVMAENLSNEAKDAVSAYVNGLGSMRNSVIDLGLFESNQRRASSCIIDFDFEPLDVFIRFSDSERKMWIKCSHSFAGFEKIGDKKYKIFYSVSSEDFASQSAIKGPFYVQYVIKYSAFSGKPVTYRGRVDAVDQLPETAEDGDLWYVGPIEQSNKEEYIWQAGKWELLGSTDFSRVYSKEEIDNKVSVIENSIDANADAIQKTRDDFTTADTNLQNQITTNKNDITVLGDQVSEIEAKIPQEASAANQLATKEEINTGLSTKQDTISDLSTIREGAALGATSVQPEDLATVATSGSYNDLADKPTIPSVGNAEIEIQKNGTKVDSFTANQATAKTINITVPTTAADVSALPASTKYGYAFDLSIDHNTYVVSLTMKDQDGTAIGTSQTIDLPLESVVVSGSYDNTNKKIVLTLQSGSTVDVPVGDLIAGLQTEITSTNKLSADLIVDGTTNKVVTATEKSTWNGKQNAISDLATIRSGAAAGATAVQNGDLATVATSGSYTDLTNKPTIPTVDSALSSTSTNAIQNKVVNTALAGKANTTHTHASCDITGLATVATSGKYSDLTGTPGVATADTLGLVKPDGNTITVTEDGVISAVGGSGSGSGFDFEGTKAEFDAAVAAGTITDDSVSLITDDVSGDTVATKAELQSVDNSKADTALSNVLANIDYVVESQVNADGSWYRKYKSGWLEQGGVYSGTFNMTSVHNLLLPFADTNYSILGEALDAYDYTVSWCARKTSFTAASFTGEGFRGTTGNCIYNTLRWEAKGQGAE